MPVSNLLRITIGMIVLANSVVGCARQTMYDGGQEESMTGKTIEEVLSEHTDEWMLIEGVVGTAIGELNGEPCIKVFVIERTDELTEKIPPQVEGFLVVIQQTGEIHALEE